MNAIAIWIAFGAGLALGIGAARTTTDEATHASMDPAETAAAARETGYGAPLGFTAGPGFLDHVERNSWVSEGGTQWHPSEWMTFGHAASQRAHAAIAVSRSRGPIRYTQNVEAEARGLNAFSDVEPVFAGRTRPLATSLGTFETTAFAYELPGGAAKTCIYYLGQRLRSGTNLEGFVCRSVEEGVDPVMARCLIESIRAPDFGLVGTPSEDCDALDEALRTVAMDGSEL